MYEKKNDISFYVLPTIDLIYSKHDLYIHNLKTCCEFSRDILHTKFHLYINLSELKFIKISIGPDNISGPYITWQLDFSGRYYASFMFNKKKSFRTKLSTPHTPYNILHGIVIRKHHHR